MEETESPDSLKINLVSLVATVYRSQSSIQYVVKEAIEVLEEAGLNFEIILVDDASPDDSWRKIEAIARSDRRVRGIRLRRNRGQQIAASAGVEAAVGDVVILMDGDGQNPISAGPEMVKRIAAGRDIVYAVSKQRNNWKDSFTSWLFWSVFTRMFKIRLIPHQLMLRAMSKEVAESFRNYSEAVRTVAGIVDDISRNYEVMEVSNRIRSEGKSNYNLWARLALMFNFVLASTNSPLNWIFGVGVVTAALAGFGAVVQIALYFTHSVPPGFTSIILAISLFGSLTLVSLGVLGRYLSIILVEVRERPLYAVSEKTQYEQNK